MLYLLFVSILWAFSFGLIKGVLTGIDPFFVSFLRILLSLLVFLPFLKKKQVDRKTTWQLFFIGMLQYGLMYIAYIYSFNFLKAYEVALFTIFTPLYVALWYDITRKKISWLNILTAILAILGTAIVVWQDIERSNFWMGFLIMQISNIAFAIGQVQYKRIMQKQPAVRDAHVFGFLYMGGVALTLLSSLIFTDWANLTLSNTQWLTLLYLGVVASGVGFFIWNVGARKASVGALAIFNNLKIPLATAVSLLFFGESTDWRSLLLGGLIVLISLFINEILRRKQTMRLSTNEQTFP
ncbi:MAG: EamA family transporter [Anaerolineaceae bacterium]|nr:EamA family transporter [Anaerolineaceae bacterium]